MVKVVHFRALDHSTISPCGCTALSGNVDKPRHGPLGPCPGVGLVVKIWNTLENWLFCGIVME